MDSSINSLDFCMHCSSLGSMSTVEPCILYRNSGRRCCPRIGMNMHEPSSPGEDLQAWWSWQPPMLTVGTDLLLHLAACVGRHHLGSQPFCKEQFFGAELHISLVPSLGTSEHHTNQLPTRKPAVRPPSRKPRKGRRRLLEFNIAKREMEDRPLQRHI